MTRSDYQREVRAPQGGGSRPRRPHKSLTDEAPRLILPPNSRLRSPKVTTFTGCRWPARITHVSCGPHREGAPARDFLTMSECMSA
eukprot:1315135-Pyramimonas_sp.AAC.1